jgi:hypothetical protein
LMFGIVLPCLTIYETCFLKPVLYGLHGSSKIGWKGGVSGIFLYLRLVLGVGKGFSSSGM